MPRKIVKFHPKSRGYPNLCQRKVRHIVWASNIIGNGKNIVVSICVTSTEFLGYSMVLLFLSDYLIESDLFLINF